MEFLWSGPETLRGRQFQHGAHSARFVADREPATMQLRDFLQSERIAPRADDDLTLMLAVPNHL